ncbi:MAG: Gfo/Idh/MocA family oxidoreductase [Ktedonobacteraceae bacterium]
MVGQCNWGVLGPGFIATHAVIPALQQVRGARVLAVASRDRTRATASARLFNIKRVYDDYQALLDDPDIAAVYIALPNHLHRTWTVRAAQAGKHVLCEKPLALNAAEGAEMIAACQQAGVLLMEAVMYRFHPRMLHLKRMLANGELGELRFLHAAFSFPFRAPQNYRAYPEYGGGALLDVGSYCVNAARWLAASEPQEVQEFSYSRNEKGVDMATSALLRFAGDVLAHVQCSFSAAEHQVIEVVGSEAAVTAPLAFTAWREDHTTLLIQRGATSEQREFAPADPYQAMVAHFTACATGCAELLYPPADGQATLRVLDQLRTAGTH